MWETWTRDHLNNDMAPLMVWNTIINDNLLWCAKSRFSSKNEKLFLFPVKEKCWSLVMCSINVEFQQKLKGILMEGQESEIFCWPDGTDRHFLSLFKPIMALDFKADIGFFLHSPEKWRGLLHVCWANLIPCVLCTASLTASAKCKRLSIFFLHFALPGIVGLFFLLFFFHLLVIMFETNCHGPYVCFSFVFQVGFSNKQMDLFLLSALRSLPLNLLSITLTETGLCCQTQH